MKDKYVQYYVEGQDEKRLIDELKTNIDFLKSCNRVSDMICITQVKNLEDELLRSCNGIRQIKDLLGSKSNKEYKTDLIRVHNLAKKLEEKGFDISKFWALQPGDSFSIIHNDTDLIKI